MSRPENRYILRDLYSQQQAVTRLTLVLTIAPNWLGKVSQNPRKGFGHAWPVCSPTFLVVGQGGASASVSRTCVFAGRRRLLSNPSESHVVGGHGVMSAAESNFLTSCSRCFKPQRSIRIRPSTSECTLRTQAREPFAVHSLDHAFC